MAGNALQAVLDKAARDIVPPSKPTARKVPKPANLPDVTPVAAEAQVGDDDRKKFHRPSRDNRRFIGGHFAPAVGKQLRLLAAEDDTTVQALLEEALDLLFVKKGKAKIADLSAK